MTSFSISGLPGCRVPSVRRSVWITGRSRGKYRRFYGVKAPQVVSFGDSLFDMLANTLDVPREKVTSWTPKVGGACCNVAAGLAKFGVDVAFVSAVGDDALGDALLELLQSIGVNVEYVERRPEPTRDVYVTRSSDGERDFVGFGRKADQFADCHITRVPTDLIKGCDVLVCGTLGQAYHQTGRVTREAVSVAKDAGVAVFVDVNWRPVFFRSPSTAKPLVAAVVDRADIVKLTNDEAEWLLDIDSSAAMTHPAAVLDRLQHAKGVLVTAGRDGAAFCFRTPSGKAAGFVPAFDVDAVDTTGAGDAFTSGFVYRMLEAGGLDRLSTSSEDLRSAVVFASASGGATTMGEGAIEGQPSSIDAVQKIIDQGNPSFKIIT